jgi:hypothetical protein
LRLASHAYAGVLNSLYIPLFREDLLVRAVQAVDSSLEKANA